ncbi:hypothetical protein [Bremerella cremea]|uniref:hypothetical protein n=1 Tax=Bremerella cremea TaxID=1031537 RepID=UPI0031EFE139
MTSNNPFQSPTPTAEPGPKGNSSRQSALVSLRLAIVMLTAAGLVNYHAYDTMAMGPHVSLFGLMIMMRVFQLVLVGLLVIGCWLLLLPTLEVIAERLRSWFAKHVDAETWNEALYRSLAPAAILALPGSILWIVWVIGFYYLKAPFLLISYAVGIPAHLLAACIYVPLLYRWYHLWRYQPAPSESGSVS